MSSPEVTVILPVLNRPQRIIPVVSSIVHATTNPQVIIVPSHDSQGYYNVLEEALELSDGVEWHAFKDPNPSCGNYAKKINWAVRYAQAPWIFTGADDLYFHDGWFDQCMDTVRYRPDVCVVGTNDLGHPRVYAMHETATHSLVRVDYVRERGTIDEKGKVLHEGYVHEFVDDELVGTAKYRGVWAFSMLSHVEHMHPVWGKGAWDATYEDQDRRMNESRALFYARCPLWRGHPV